jgi:enediyne biosynthesis protein E3
MPFVQAVLLDRRDAEFDRRGFRLGDASARARLTAIGRTFIDGYNAAWTCRAESLPSVLEAREAALRGFAFEGAAMALMLGDVLLPWRRPRWTSFAAGPANAHVYLAVVGAGWALARVGRLRPGFRRLDPLLRWLVFDGCGFHDAYFRAERTVRLQRRSRRVGRGAEPIYDQGVGRGLWFVECADPDAIAHTIGSFPPSRRSDLWAGVALAATYAGGADGEALRTLRRRAAGFEADLAQGSAFAAKARERGGSSSPELELAVRTLSGLTSAGAARITELAAAETGDLAAPDAYHRWRAATRRLLAEPSAAA